ncbi:PREDICTED: probable aldo-keto reductase [Prunus dulcis]|uniref:PREDICTED: probable aldo-keto reductase n=1 Tax=Prunus dulcis TaxID=3755 RepID=A0A5E4GDD3_PRUDU|nr:hypothetical protein L3X38_042323 [Prunus dulcis]VVA37631.1 PREDICTED: probable aldo-keto reductase [Prunus dulcis]
MEIKQLLDTPKTSSSSKASSSGSRTSSTSRTRSSCPCAPTSAPATANCETDWKKDQPGPGSIAECLAAGVDKEDELGCASLSEVRPAKRPKTLLMSLATERLCLGVERLGLRTVAMGSRSFGASKMTSKARRPCYHAARRSVTFLIHHAIDSGVTFLDTSDIYGLFTNEILLGKVLKGGVRKKVELATKFGISFADNKPEVRGDPAYVRATIEGSLTGLGVDSGLSDSDKAKLA